MSVKVHEAFSLDSFMDRLLYWDDFLGDQIKDEWDTTLVGGGTATVVDAQTGGIVRLSTPTASDEATLNWNNIRTLHVDQKVIIEARVRINGGVTDTNRRLLGLRKNISDYIMMYHNADSTTLNIICRNVALTAFGTAFSLDAGYHIFRIECHTHGGNHVHFYYDGVETTNSPIVTNIPDDDNDYLQPDFDITTNADTDPATSMDIDYVVVRQEI